MSKQEISKLFSRKQIIDMIVCTIVFISGTLGVLAFASACC